MAISDDAAKNRAYWDQRSDEYQAEHAPQLNERECVWGIWGLPEDELDVLGNVRDKDILELGCGAAQWSIFLAKRGARPVGLDNSARQLEHARRLMAEAGVTFPLVHASADDVPLPDSSFDIVFCDHGGMSFADPERTVPEAARLLRPGGLLAFNMVSAIAAICQHPETGIPEPTLHFPYFGLRRFEWEEHDVDFYLPYGEWIRLFRRNGFVVEDLIELRPPEGAVTTYQASLAWSRSWPGENIWRVRKESVLP